MPILIKCWLYAGNIFIKIQYYKNISFMSKMFTMKYKYCKIDDFIDCMLVKYYLSILAKCKQPNIEVIFNDKNTNI